MRFIKQIVRPGKYSVPQGDGTRKEVAISSDRIKRWVDTFKQMRTNGLNVYAPWGHADSKPSEQAPSDPRQNAGFWEELWQDADGTMSGRLHVPLDEDARRVGETVSEVSLAALPEWEDGQGHRYQDPVMHIALVQHPVVAKQDNFQPTDNAEQPALALSLSLLTEGAIQMADDTAPTPAMTEPAAEAPETPTSATGASMQDVLVALSTVGLSLPDDTTAENLAERIITAAKAIKGKEDQDKEPGVSPEGAEQAKEQPMPIAMSLADNPEAQKVLHFANQYVAGDYKRRVESLVESGRLTPAAAIETIKPLMEGFQLSLDQDGKAMPTELDRLLSCLETLPENATGLLGQQTGRTKNTSNPLDGLRLAFEEPLPEDYQGKEPISLQRAEEVLDEMDRMTGRKVKQKAG